MTYSRLLALTFTLLISAAYADTAKFGVPILATGVANLVIGRDGGEVAYRIRALKSGWITAFSYYHRHSGDGGGYSKGNGGHYLVRLVRDDGTTDHFPDTISTPLASAEIENLLSFNGIKEITFYKPAYVEKDKIYHLWFTNIYANPENNYASVNNLNPTEAYAPTQPLYKDIDLALLYRRAQTNGQWQHNGRHTPVYSFHFQDSVDTQSQGYMMAWSESGVKRIGGNHAVRQLIQNNESHFTSSRLNIALLKNGKPGDLILVIQETNGSNRKEFTIPSSLVSNTSSIRALEWTTLENIVYTFNISKSYFIELHSPSSTLSLNDYFIYPIEEAPDSKGFKNGGTLENGYAQYRTTGDWYDGWHRKGRTSLYRNVDLMLYFENISSPSPTFLTVE